MSQSRRRPLSWRERVSLRHAATVTVAVAALGAVALSGTLPANAASPTSPPTPAPTGALHRVMQNNLNHLVTDDAFPAALASMRTRNGHTRNYTAGIADVDTRARVPVDGQLRIGSNTKTFTAVVVLQLVGEGKIGLDTPIETYLPNLLRGDGIDGRHITVRQLLQHTAGLPDYADVLMPKLADYRHTYFEARDLIDIALTQKATSPPGTEWKYSNTDYIVAGLLIQKVTGRPVAEAITHRVIKRLRLRHTYYPTVGDEGIREPHPHGYLRGTPLLDYTQVDPSLFGAAGQMISTNSDLNRFFSALITGKLLLPAQLAQMQTTVEVTQPGLPAGARYGLGLMSTPLSCGGVAWGHGGDVPGYTTRGAVTEDGQAAVNIAVTASPRDLATFEHLQNAVEDALCH